MHRICIRFLTSRRLGRGYFDCERCARLLELSEHYIERPNPHMSEILVVLIGLIGLIESPSSDATGAGLSLLA